MSTKQIISKFKEFVYENGLKEMPKDRYQKRKIYYSGKPIIEFYDGKEWRVYYADKKKYNW